MDFIWIQCKWLKMLGVDTSFFFITPNLKLMQINYKSNKARIINKNNFMIIFFNFSLSGHKMKIQFLIPNN